MADTNPYLAMIAERDEAVEYWRQRAEAAELALRGGNMEPGVWNERVYPLSLFQTRIMRLLARRDMTSLALQVILQNEYPDTTEGSIKAHLTHIRSRLPCSIAPPKGAPCRGTRHPYSVPDRAALKDFLETGELPVSMRRAA
jgi:hypothetical protein